MRVSPALQVHESPSPILEKDGMQSQDCVSSFGVSCWGQGRQEEAPTLEKVPFGQAEQEVAANSAYSPFSHSTQASLTVMVPGGQGAHPVAATLLSVPAGHRSHSFFPPMLYFPISHSLQLWEARSAKKPGPQYVQVSLPALETKPSVCSQVVHDVLPGLLNFPSSQESQRAPASSTTSFSPPAHLSQPKEPSTRL